MLVGISALTTIGLRRFYDVESGIPPFSEVCPDGEDELHGVHGLLKDAGIAQIQAIFRGAAVCAVVAAVSAVRASATSAPWRGARTASDFVRDEDRARTVTPSTTCWTANREYAATFAFAGFDGIAHGRRARHLHGLADRPPRDVGTLPR